MTKWSAVDSLLHKAYYHNILWYPEATEFWDCGTQWLGHFEIWQKPPAAIQQRQLLISEQLNNFKHKFRDLTRSYQSRLWALSVIDPPPAILLAILAIQIETFEHKFKAPIMIPWLWEIYLVWCLVVYMRWNLRRILHVLRILRICRWLILATDRTSEQ